MVMMGDDTVCRIAPDPTGWRALVCCIVAAARIDDDRESIINFRTHPDRSEMSLCDDWHGLF